MLFVNWKIIHYVVSSQSLCASINKTTVQDMLPAYWKTNTYICIDVFEFEIDFEMDNEVYFQNLHSILQQYESEYKMLRAFIWVR